MRTTRSIRNKRRNKFPIITILLVFAVIAAGILISMNILNSTLAQNKNGISDLSTDKIDTGKLYSKNVALVDVESGKVLYGKNEGETCYPASLTKIMTGITAITERESLDKSVTLNNDLFYTLRNENASMAGYQEGDRTTVKDLLYGSLLASGAEASVGLSQATSGSESNFADLMNDKANELNMTGTHFTNSTGLQDEDNYSTPKDMGKLLRYALTNSTFKDVFTTKSYNIRTDSNEFTVRSTFFSEYMGENSKYTVEGAKTGTTSDAGQCLASLVTKYDREFILITMGAPIGGGIQPFSFDDLDYIFKTI